MSDRGTSSGSTRTIGDQIEFLPPNDAAFGTADVADFVGFDGADTQSFGDDGPRSKWLPAAASLVVLALLGGGIIAAAPWDDADDAAPAPSTTVAPPSASSVRITDQAPPTTDRPLGINDVGPAGYVLEGVGTFQLAGAWNAGVEYRPPETYADDRFDLWTSNGATRTTGQWLAIATNKGRGSSDETLPDGVRVLAGKGIGVVSTSADGVSRLLFKATDDTPFELSGFGFDLGALLTVAAQVGAGPDDTIEYGSLPDGIFAGLTPMLSEHVPNGGLNPFLQLARARVGVYYVHPESGGTVEVTVNQPTDVDAAVLDFLFQPVTDLSNDDRARLDQLTQAGRRFRLSTLPDWPGTILATSMQPGDELTSDTIGSQPGDAISVFGTGVSASTMIRVLSQLRSAGDDEWVDVIDRSNRGLLNVDVPADVSEVIGSQEQLGAGRSWYRIEMIAGARPYIFVSNERSGWGAPIPDIPSAPTVRRYASPTYTYVVATARQPSPIRTIRVTRDGMPPEDIPMVHVGESVDAAGYGFTEMLPVAVEFLDENGNVVAA